MVYIGSYSWMAKDGKGERTTYDSGKSGFAGQEIRKKRHRSRPRRNQVRKAVRNRYEEKTVAKKKETPNKGTCRRGNGRTTFHASLG